MKNPNHPLRTLLSWSAGLIMIFLLLFVNESAGQSDLESKFANPPDEAKPRGYWVWAHGNYDYTTIQSELKAFKEMGLGGVDIFDMGIADPLGVIPPGNTFMGDEMVDGIAFALQEAKKLNLRMGLSVSNGWNAGGDWTENDEKLMRLLFWSDTIQGPANISEIGFPKVPVTFKKPYGSYELFPQFTSEGFPEYYENVALVAYPLVKDSLVDDLDKVKYFDAGDIKGNKVDVQLPAGEWVIMRAVVTPLGQKMWMRSDMSNGFIMDHYSKKATKHHFEHIIGKLEDKIGDLGQSSLERLYLASFEAEDYVIWSPELREAFYAHHGYHIDPYIPVFSGLSVIDKETTERFLHDYRTAVSEMFVNNHYRQASGICRDHGVLLASESGGPGPPLHYVPTEDSKALGAVDIMRGEFWHGPRQWDDRNGNNLLQVVKSIGSAAHIYGHKIVEMEAFTSHSHHWEDAPWDLKILADRAFCEGMTRVVYHTMPHSPKEAGVPGWSYQAGTHIHPKMTWWPMSDTFHEYLARCSAMLMEGNFVADVAYYKGGEIPNFSTTKYIHPDLGFGYDYDDLNTEILLQTTEVNDGKIVLPTGMAYEVLVLPESEKMDLKVLEKIEELISKGATVIGPRPSKTYSLAHYQQDEQKLNDIADGIWGRSGKKKTDKKYGTGSIVNSKTAREVLLKKGVSPDIQVLNVEGTPNIDFIHRSAPDHEIYFVRSTDSLAQNVEIDFRVKGMVPEFWHAEEGSTRPVPVFRSSASGTIIPMHLEAFGSVFVVFGKKPPAQHIQQITCNGEKVFPSTALDASGLFFTTSDAGQMRLVTDQAGEYAISYSNGEQATLNVESPVETFPVEGSWDVRFPAGWRVPTLQHFEALQDWTSFDQPDMKHFSGIATYRKTFSVESGQLAESQLWVLDLGKVGNVATVYLNGKRVGNSIFPPYRMDISKHLVKGDNHLVVEVANTWLNRLVLDATLPLDQQLTQSNLARGNDPKDRPWKGREPLPSGLIGPVKIIKCNSIKVE